MRKWVFICYALVFSACILTFLVSGQAKNKAKYLLTLQQAKKGDVTAQYNLGVYYADGIGVQEDDVEAVKWYRKAAEQGYEIAISNKPLFANMMTPRQIVKAEQLAATCLANNYKNCD